VSRVEAAFEEVRLGRFEKAHVAFKAITDDWMQPVRGRRILNGRMPILFYMRGYTAQKLARRAEAAGEPEKAEGYREDVLYSVEQCRGFDPKALGGNRYYNKVLLLKAGTQFDAEAYQGALTTYKLFLKERDPNNPKDRFSEGVVFGRMAVCSLRLNGANSKEAGELLDKVMKLARDGEAENALLMRVTGEYFLALLEE